MESNVLNDKSVRPNDDIVFSIIGDKSLLWQQIMSYLYDNHKDISKEWNYYNDGKSWLFRTLKKKKTLFWVRILNDTFRIAFWFGDKAESFIEQSDLTENIKNEFKIAKKMGVMGRCISIEMSDSKDFDNVKKLIEIKVKIK
jgi:Protein of unknown function (DUF3788)